MTAWTPDGAIASMVAVSRDYAPPPPAGTPDPFRWGSPEVVAAIFARTGESGVAVDAEYLEIVVRKERA